MLFYTRTAVPRNRCGDTRLSSRKRHRDPRGRENINAICIPSRLRNDTNRSLGSGWRPSWVSLCLGRGPPPPAPPSAGPGTQPGLHDNTQGSACQTGRGFGSHPIRVRGVQHETGSLRPPSPADPEATFLCTLPCVPSRLQVSVTPCSAKPLCLARRHRESESS